MRFLKSILTLSNILHKTKQQHNLCAIHIYICAQNKPVEQTAWQQKKNSTGKLNGQMFVKCTVNSKIFSDK